MTTVTDNNHDEGNTVKQEGGQAQPPDSTLENANIQPPDNVSGIDAENWRGDKRYFQTGIKAGRLKPSAQDGEGKQAEKTKEFSGLNIEALKASTPNTAPAQTVTQAEEKKRAKAEKKLVEAKIASKLVMRVLDTITGWISSGTYGADFTDQQRKERNKYREELEQDWQDYLQTLDVPMHPALVAVFGSVLYVAPAFETVKGKERVQSFREKIVSKIAVGIFARKKG